MANTLYSPGIRTIGAQAGSPVPPAAPVSSALTPEEIAEADAKEAAANAAPPIPAPVAEAAPAPQPAPVVPPAPASSGLTPAEIAEADAKEAAATQVAKPTSAAESLSAAELAEMVIKEPTFNLEVEFRKLGPRSLTATRAESQKYNALLEKFADADNILRERGFKWEDRPSVGEVGHALKGFAVGVAKYAKPFIDVGAHPLPDPNNPMEADPNQYARDQRGIAESGAGTEASVGGLGELGRKAGTAFMRKIGVSKPLWAWTMDDKVKAFTDKLKRGEATEQVLKGQGPAMQALGGEVIKELEAKGLPIRPEEVAAKTAGDPVALWAFGAGMKGMGSLVPRYVKTTLKKAEDVVARAVPKVVGGGITAAADVAGGTAKVVEKTAPTVGAVVGAVKGAEVAGVPGAIVGAGAGRAGGVAAAKSAAVVRGAAEKVSEFGRQVSGKSPMVSDYAQLVRSVAQSVPGAVVKGGEGLAFDVGLAAITAESPEDTKGAIGVGTALGFVSGAGHTARHVVSGQVVAPRAFGISTPVATSAKANTTFKGMHDEAFRAMTPGERTNVNAIRTLMKGWNSDFFAGKDAATVEAKLTEAGVDPARAKQLSEAEGFFSIDLPGSDGVPRRTIIARNVAAAPHESFHAFQDVIGEAANRVLDEQVMREYGDRWDAEGQAYADRLPGEAGGKSWEERILDASGWGRAELVDKMMRELAASNEAQGNPPNPELIKRLVVAEISRLEAEKGGDPRNVWDGQLSAEEAKTVANRYLARELAAENFDVAVKNRGIGLQEGNSLPQKFARVIAAVISGLGGNPLLPEAVSEIGQIQPRIGVMKAVSEAVRTQFPVVEPGKVAPTPRDVVAPKPPARPGAPGQGVPATEEQIAQAAAEAQAVADAAPDTVAPGAVSSPREMLGTIAQAIGDRSGVKINYVSAPGEPAGATTSNRTARRAIIEAFRSMPAAAKALWEKNFFPERVVALKDNKFQVMGWSPEAFAANAHKMAKALIDTRKGDFSPYPLDPTTGSFTTEGWQKLYEDVNTFVENQSAGRTGSGEDLVVPRSVTDAGGFAPPVTGTAKKLGQSEADFINMLFNFKIPETPRIQKGKRPLNIIGQEVSEATIPGRTEAPTRPREAFSGQEAVAQGIEGREIRETNPTRAMIERALGDQMPSMIEAIQRLNLENINDVTITPEQPQFRGNTLTLTAGLQPPRRKQPVRQFAPDEMWVGHDGAHPAPFGHMRWAREKFPDSAEGQFPSTTREGSAYGRAERAGYLRMVKTSRALLVDNSTKYPTWESVPRALKEAIEQVALDRDLAVRFNDDLVIPRFKPEAEAGPGAGETTQWQPRTEAGKKLEQEGFKFRIAHSERGTYNIEVMRNNEQVGVLESSMKDTETAAVDWVRVIPEFRKQGLSEAMYRELASRLQEEGIRTLTGTIIAEGPGATRNKVFGEAPEVVPVPELAGSGAIQVNSRIDPNAQYAPNRGRKGYEADEMWLGRDRLNAAPEGHKQWADDNFPAATEAIGTPTAAYERANAAGYLRVVKGMGTIMVDASPKYPTWDKVPRGYKNALEASAVDNDMRVTFNGKEVIGKFKPGDGGDQFQPQRKLPNSAGDTEFDVTHLSSRSGLTSISPKFFGKGKATPIDLRGDPKSFFFLKGSEYGQDTPLFKNKGLEEYQGTINGSGLYDLRKGKEDPLNWRNTVNRSSADAAVKKAGYSGILLDTADGRKVVAMFKPTDVTQGGDQMQPSAPEALAEEYAKKAGIEYKPSTTLKKPDEALMKDLADFYEEATHTPDDPAVVASYDALKQETLAQYNDIVAAGYTIEPFTGKGEPYGSSAEMIKDVKENKHLFYLETDKQFGTNEGPVTNLLVTDSGVEIAGKSVPYNDLFRAVHDFFGHVKDGHQFGPRGEFNAWNSHSGMYSPEAQGALAAETLAQNAWVNFGKQVRGPSGEVAKKGEPGYIPLPERPFGEQKNTVVTPELMDRAMAQLSPSKDPRAVKSAAMRDKRGKIFEASMHWEAIDKAQDAGSNVGSLEDGFVTNEGEFLNRAEAYDRAVELEQIAAYSGMRQTSTKGNLESVQFEESQKANTLRWKNRTVKESVDNVLAMSAPDFNQFMRDYKGAHANSATGIAIDIGKKSRTPEDILALKVAADMASERYKEARAAGDLDTAMAEAMRKQTFEEAVQAAERSRPALNELMSKHQFQLPSPEKVEDIRKGKAFGATFDNTGKEWEPGKQKFDLLELAKIPKFDRDKLTHEKLAEVTSKYAEILANPNVMLDVSMVSGDFKARADISIVAAVPRELRENTKTFAEANDLYIIKESETGRRIRVGGGENALKTPEHILAALPNLFEGTPVDVQAITGGVGVHNPLTEMGKEMVAKGFKFKEHHDPIGGGSVFLEKAGETVAELHWRPDGEKGAEVGSVDVERKFRRQGLAETLYREMAARLQKKGITELTGEVYDEEAPVKLREKVFGETERAVHTLDMSGDPFPDGPRTFVRSKIDPTVQYQAPKDSELAKIRSGETFGNTFLPNGQVWNRGDKEVDVVTLASTNVPREELTPENFDKATAPYAKALEHPSAVVGAFNFEKDKGPESSIDINVLVPQEFRENTKKFAADNQQISFWDPVKGEEVKTGGSSETVLTSPKSIAEAMEKLVEGKPVDVKAQLQPQTEAGKELEKQRFSWRASGSDGSYTITLHKGKENVAVIEASRVEDSDASEVDWVRTHTKYRKQGISKVMYRELAARLQKDGITNLTGIVISEGPIQSRREVFGAEPKDITGPDLVKPKEGQFPFKVVSSKIDPNAQYQARTEAGKKLEEEGYYFQRTPGIIELLKDGQRVAVMEWSLAGDHRSAEVDWVRVDKNLRKKGIGEALYRELAARLQKSGITKLTGYVINEGPIQTRTKVFGEPEVASRHYAAPEKKLPADVVSYIDPDATYQLGEPTSTRAKTEAGKELEKKGFGFQIYREDSGRRTIRLSHKGKKDVAVINTSLGMEGEADINWVHVDTDFRKQGVGEALYREMATLLKKDGVTKIIGDPISDAPEKIRQKVFGEPKVTGRRGVHTLTSTIDHNVQYQPQTSAGKDLVKKGFRIVETNEGTLGELALKRGGQNIGYISWRVHPPELKSAHVSIVSVDSDFRRQGLAETLYREVAARLQKLGITRLRGSVVAEGPIQLRQKLFGEAEELSKPGGVRHVTSRIDPDAEYQPVSPEDVVPRLSTPSKVLVNARSDEE